MNVYVDSKFIFCAAMGVHIAVFLYAIYFYFDIRNAPVTNRKLRVTGAFAQNGDRKNLLYQTFL